MMRRRENGDGSIRQRPNGKWEVRYTDTRVKDPKKRRKSATGATYKEAKERLKAILREIDDYEELEPTEMTFGKWLDIWMVDFKRGSLRDGTYSSYALTIETHIRPRLGSIKLTQLKAIDIQGLYTFLLENGGVRHKIGGLSSASVHKVKNIISGALKLAVKNNFIKSNPVDATEPPPLERKAINVFTKEEQGALLTALSRYNTQYLFSFALATGMRIGEVIALKIEDIDFKTKEINIDKALHRVKDKYTGILTTKIGPTKTKHSVRVIPLMPAVEQMVNNQVLLLKKLKKDAGRMWKKSDILFPNEMGEYRTQSGTRCIFLKILKRAGIRKGTVHDLRHTFVTNALNAGVAPQNVARIIGHRDGATTLKYYAHYVRTEADNQLRVLDKQIHEQSGLALEEADGGKCTNIIKEKIETAKMTSKMLSPVKSVDHIIETCVELFSNTSDEYSMPQIELLMQTMFEQCALKKRLV